jgi:hypothetical protein
MLPIHPKFHSKYLNPNKINNPKSKDLCTLYKNHDKVGRLFYPHLNKILLDTHHIFDYWNISHNFGNNLNNFMNQTPKIKNQDIK